MESADSYQNVNDLVAGQRREYTGNEKMKPEGRVGPEEPIRGKLSPRVVYTFLGLSTLLSVVTLGIALVLMTVVFEMKTQGARFRMEPYEGSGNDLFFCHASWTKFKKSCYQFSTDRKTWNEASKYCTSLDSHLVVINSVGEEEFVNKSLQTRSWIGLSDSVLEGDWHWVDGTDYSSSVTFWMAGEPNNENEEDCVEMLSDGTWNDISCGIPKCWICETPAQFCRP